MEPQEICGIPSTSLSHIVNICDFKSSHQNLKKHKAIPCYQQANSRVANIIKWCSITTYQTYRFVPIRPISFFDDENTYMPRTCIFGGVASAASIHYPRLEMTIHSRDISTLHFLLAAMVNWRQRWLVQIGPIREKEKEEQAHQDLLPVRGLGYRPTSLRRNISLSQPIPAHLHLSQPTILLKSPPDSSHVTTSTPRFFIQRSTVPSKKRTYDPQKMATTRFRCHYHVPIPSSLLLDPGSP